MAYTALHGRIVSVYSFHAGRASPWLHPISLQSCKEADKSPTSDHACCCLLSHFVSPLDSKAR